MRTKIFAVAVVALGLLVGGIALAFTLTGSKAQADPPPAAPEQPVAVAGCCVTGDCCCPGQGSCCAPAAKAKAKTAAVKKAASCCLTGDCCCPGHGACCAAATDAKECCAAKGEKHDNCYEK